MTYMVSFSGEGSTGSEGSVCSSAKWEMFLCRDDRFLYQDESSVSVDAGGSGGFDAGGDSDSGQWRIVSQGDLVGIEFRWSNGQTSTHQPDYAEGATYVDGERWFVTDDNPHC